MAEIVGAFATSHTPVMLNFPDAIDKADRGDIYAGFLRVGAALARSKPDVVVVISDDHLHNFYLDNFPAFCIGASDVYRAPAEHWLKAERHELKGNAAVSGHLIREALNAGFDPAFSMHLTLDHGVLTPLVLAGISTQVTVVPILVNCVQPPMPTMRRCLEWGRMLRNAIHSCDGVGRVALLATGGISHDVGTPRMGFVNEVFDREFLRLLATKEQDELVRFCTAHVNEAGNGGEEIRNWLVVHGATAGAQFVTDYYKAVPGWYTGIALGQWELGSSASA
jgi:aromatic ring-opening dioxygenase catalytic subunit (LigB family)